MRIPCPYCGPRSHDEFAYYGDATVRRPTSTGTGTGTGTGTESEFYDYVYVRDNPCGAHRELWFHQGGCHEWLVVERDTRTHAIASAVPARSVFGARGSA
jgi:sarcosine oxidase subunit delta